MKRRNGGKKSEALELAKSGANIAGLAVLAVWFLRWAASKLKPAAPGSSPTSAAPAPAPAKPKA